jgi:hypothetical protein
VSLASSSSPTAPAGSRETESGYVLSPRIVRREFGRLFAEHDIATHPAEVRRLAERFCASGRPLTDVESIVIAYADPTGETAARNVDRERGR